MGLDFLSQVHLNTSRIRYLYIAWWIYSYITEEKPCTSASHKATRIDYLNYCHYQNC